jgi:hypothetical protein
MSIPFFSLIGSGGEQHRFPSGRPTLLCFLHEEYETCNLSMRYEEAPMADHRDGPRVANKLFALHQTLPTSQQQVLSALMGQATQAGQVRGFAAETPEQEAVDEVIQRWSELVGEQGEPTT